MAPTFSLYDVVPEPLPHIPARTQPIPSTRIPDVTYFVCHYTVHTLYIQDQTLLFRVFSSFTLELFVCTCILSLYVYHAETKLTYFLIFLTSSKQ